MVALTHWVYFIFFMRTANVVDPRLSAVFQRRVCLGSFSACWKQAYINLIPKGLPSYSVANCRPISITSA